MRVERTTSARRGQGFSRWWILALAACGGVLALFTPWALLVEAALLAFVIFRLTRRPPRTEAIVLIVAMVILTVVLVALVAAGIAVVNLEGTYDGNSIPLP